MCAFPPYILSRIDTSVTRSAALTNSTDRFSTSTMIFTRASAFDGDAIEPMLANARRNEIDPVLESLVFLLRFLTDEPAATDCD